MNITMDSNAMNAIFGVATVIAVVIIAWIRRE
jgi:hypothetical protein